MLVWVVSCDVAHGGEIASSEATNDTITKSVETENADTTEKTYVTEVMDTDETIDENNGVFKAGYAREVITPELPAPIGTDIMTTVRDDLYATCIAVSDGEHTALIYTVDLKNIGPKVYNSIQLRVSATTKVPRENIIISATHNHSAFTPLDNVTADSSESLKVWTLNFPLQMTEIAKAAISDMEDAEIYTGSASTPGMAFIRRYVHEDGSYSGIMTGSHLKSTSKIVDQVADIDDTLQLVRFVRKDKKDIVMVNWQAHLAQAIGVLRTSVTADLVYYVREKVETDKNDALVAYFAGASGNINLVPPNESMRKYTNYAMVGRALGSLIVDTMSLENLTKLNSGEIKGISTTYAAEIRKESAEKVRQAREVMALKEGSAEQWALMAKYGFESLYAPRTIISCDNITDTHREFNLGSVSFGDLAFVAAPYEMFDNNGVQIKEASPFEVTFILTGAGGYWAYLPSIEYCTEYGGYEVDDTKFAFGTAEKLVAEYIRMLNEHKGIS